MPDDPSIQDSTSTDVTSRLLQLLTRWRGDERGEILASLHVACVAAAGPGRQLLAPSGVLLVDGLEATTLRERFGVRMEWRGTREFSSGVSPYDAGVDGAE
jgi:hypothetical protein